MKKSSLCLLFVLLTSSPIFCQPINAANKLTTSINQNILKGTCMTSTHILKSITENKDEVVPISDLRNKGIIFASLGACAAGAGLILLLTPSNDPENDFGNFIRSAGGILLLVNGTVGLAIGGSMIARGQERINKANAKTSFYITPLSSKFIYRF